ncbi:MAG: hypothetical protein R3E02_03900 [Blastomonas sp.]
MSDTAKLRIGSVISDAFAVFSRRPVILLGLAFVMVGIPGFIQNYAFSPLNPRGLAADFGDGLAQTIELISTIIITILTIWAQALLVLICVEDMSTGEVNVEECFNISARKFPLLLAFTFLAGAVLIIIFAALLIGMGLAVANFAEQTAQPYGVFIIVMLALLAILAVALGISALLCCVIPAMTMEDSGLVDSVRRSLYLTQGSRKRIMVILGIYVFLAMLLGGILGGGAAYFGPDVTTPYATAMQEIQYSMATTPYFLAMMVVTTLVTAIGSAIIASIYVALRKRRDGVEASDLGAIFE